MFDYTNAESMVIARVRSRFPEATYISVDQVVHIESEGCQCQSETPRTVVMVSFNRDASAESRTKLSIDWTDEELVQLFIGELNNVSGYLS